MCVNDRAKQEHAFLMANCDKYSEGMVPYKVTEQGAHPVGGQRGLPHEHTRLQREQG